MSDLDHISGWIQVVCAVLIHVFIIGLIIQATIGTSCICWQICDNTSGVNTGTTVAKGHFTDETFALVTDALCQCQTEIFIMDGVAFVYKNLARLRIMYFNMSL